MSVEVVHVQPVLQGRATREGNLGAACWAVGLDGAGADRAARAATTQVLKLQSKSKK